MIRLAVVLVLLVYGVGSIEARGRVLMEQLRSVGSP